MQASHVPEFVNILGQKVPKWRDLHQVLTSNLKTTSTMILKTSN